METDINSQNFNKEVIDSDIPVIVDFWATWCGPCLMLGPEIEKLAEKFDNKIKICKVNVDDCVDIAVKYGVEVIPTLIMFDKGSEKQRTSGYMKLEEIIKTFNL